MRVVNFCGSRFTEMRGDWERIYFLAMKAFHTLGYEVRVSPYLEFPENSLPEYTTIGIEDNCEHIYVYNHTYKELVKKNNFLGEKTFFLKPTGPTGNCFTIDPVGFAAASSITYKEPYYHSLKVGKFFTTVVDNIIKNKAHKWENRTDIILDSSQDVVLPQNYTLVIGQMPADSTVQEMSFGDHWEKFKAIVLNLLEHSFLPVVLKLHPSLLHETREFTELFERYQRDIALFKDRGAIVLSGFLNLHEVLPAARVVIVENSTAGIDALFHQKPVISYGYPEYHWVTKDLRHLQQLANFVDDISWYDREKANKWLYWYYTKYLCKNEEDVYNLLKEYLEP